MSFDTHDFLCVEVVRVVEGDALVQNLEEHVTVVISVGDDNLHLGTRGAEGDNVEEFHGGFLSVDDRLTTRTILPSNTRVNKFSYSKMESTIPTQFAIAHCLVVNNLTCVLIVNP